MVKVLIVDDNKIERESLRECIEWDSVGVSLVGEANNGFSALEIILREKPDILISDIKMPQMDGIELARQAIGICPGLKIIFLTGYEEFEMAKSAVNLNAFGYIIKPVSISELYDVLKKAINSSIADNLVLQKERKLKQQLTEIIPFLKDKFIRDLLMGIEAANDSKLLEKVEFLGLRIKAGKLVVFVLQIDDYDATFDILTENEKQLRILEISNIIKSTIPSHIEDHFIISNSTYNSGYQLAVILNFQLGEPDDFSSFINIIDLLCQNIQEKINNECRLGVTIGVSRFSESLSELHSLFLQAVTSAGYKFYKGKSKIIHINDIETKSDTFTINYYQFETELVKALKTGDNEAALLLVDGLFQQVSAKKVSMKYIHNIFIELTCAIKRMLMDLGENADSVLLDVSTITEKIARLETVFDVKNYICELCTSVTQYLNGKRKDIQLVRVEKVIEIMKNNVEKNMSIDEIAGQVYLTQNYLRRVFKEKTGENLLEYFTRLKMEKAKDLLNDPGKKVHEIARKVGYESTSYFCSVFKELNGCTPNEYRENLFRLGNIL